MSDTAKRFDRHVNRQMQADRELYERRQKALIERPEVHLTEKQDARTDNGLRRDQSKT